MAMSSMNPNVEQDQTYSTESAIKRRRVQIHLRNKYVRFEL